MKRGFTLPIAELLVISSLVRNPHELLMFSIGLINL